MSRDGNRAPSLPLFRSIVAPLSQDVAADFDRRPRQRLQEHLLRQRELQRVAHAFLAKRIDGNDARLNLHARIRMRGELDLRRSFRFARIAGRRLERRVHRIGAHQALGRIERAHAQQQLAHAEIVAPRAR